jgi:hypothetical protein
LKIRVIGGSRFLPIPVSSIRPKKAAGLGETFVALCDASFIAERQIIIDP